MPNGVLKIQVRSASDSTFHVYKPGAEVIWIACDAINWRVARLWSCSGHQVSQSAEVVGGSRKGE
jgi:hypothetical protein